MVRVTIIDYGNGNANSIRWALAQLGAASTYSHRPEDVDSADHLILPGVGHHGAAMASLHQRGLVGALTRAVKDRRVPTLGICLGMQLMTRASEEGGKTSLGWVRAETTRIRPRDRRRFKVPHVGWNTISTSSASALLKGVDTDNQPFYFCHAFGIQQIEAVDHVAAVRYEDDYVALFEAGNVFGVQFHPEKSQEPGIKLLENFLQLGG